jgi:hypothetical protein
MDVAPVLLQHAVHAPLEKVSAKFAARCGYCGKVEMDYGIPTPDGWSVGVGITYKWK